MVEFRSCRWIDAGFNVLITDHLGLAGISAQDAREVLRALDDRALSRSAIAASQILLEQWHEALGDPIAADAILDRLFHSADGLNLSGESMRKVMHETESRLDQ